MENIKLIETNLADGSYLFTTKTCPHCRTAYAILDNAGYKYQTLSVNENLELSQDLDIQLVPTLAVVSDGKAQKYVGVESIKALLQ